MTIATGARVEVKTWPHEAGIVIGLDLDTGLVRVTFDDGVTLKLWRSQLRKEGS